MNPCLMDRFPVLIYPVSVLQIGDLTQVEDSFEKVKTTAYRISSDIRYANYLDHSLKRSIGQFESVWKKLKDSR